MKKKIKTFFVCLISMLLFCELFITNVSAADKSYILLYTGGGEKDSAELAELLSGGKQKNIKNHETWNVLPAKWKNGVFMADISCFYSAKGNLSEPLLEKMLELYSMNEKNTSLALLNSYTGEYMVLKNASKKVTVYQVNGKKKTSYEMKQATEITFSKDGKLKAIYIPAASLQYLYGYNCISKADLSKQKYASQGNNIDGYQGNYCLICLDPLRSGKLSGSNAKKLVDSIVREHVSPKMYYPVKAQEVETRDYVMVYTGGNWNADEFDNTVQQIGYSYQVQEYFQDGYRIYKDGEDITRDIVSQRNENSHISFFSTKNENNTIMVNLITNEYVNKFQDLSFFPNTDWGALKQQDFGIAYFDESMEKLVVFNSFSQEYGVLKNGSKKMTVYSFEGKKKATYNLTKAIRISTVTWGELKWIEEAWVPLEALQYLFGYYYVDSKELEKQGYNPKAIYIQNIVERADKKAYVEEYCYINCSFLSLDPTRLGKWSNADVIASSGQEFENSYWSIADVVASSEREYENSYYYLLAKEADEAIRNGSLEIFTSKMKELENSRHLYSLNEETGTYIMQSCIRAAVERLKTMASEMTYEEFTRQFLKMEQEGDLDWLRKEQDKDEVVAVAIERLLREDTSRYGMWNLTYKEFIDMYHSIGTENDLFLKTLKEKGTAHTENLKYYEYDLVPEIEFVFDDILAEKVFCLQYAPFNYNSEDLESGNWGKGRFEAFYDHGGVCGILAETYEYFIRDILGEKDWQYAQYGEVDHAVVIVKTEDGRCFQVDNGESDYWWLGSLLIPDNEKIGNVTENVIWREAFENWKVQLYELSEVYWFNFTACVWSYDKNEWQVRPVWYDYDKSEWQMYMGTEMPKYLKFVYTGLPGKVISMAGYTKLSGYIDLDELEFH